MRAHFYGFQRTSGSLLSGADRPGEDELERLKTELGGRSVVTNECILATVSSISDARKDKTHTIVIDNRIFGARNWGGLRVVRGSRDSIWMGRTLQFVDRSIRQYEDRLVLLSPGSFPDVRLVILGVLYPQWFLNCPVGRIAWLLIPCHGGHSRESGFPQRAFRVV